MRSHTNARIVTLFLLAAGLLFSCRKEKVQLPEEPVTDPEFFMNCKIDGQSSELRAGDNAYLMNTSVMQDSANLYSYKGELKQSNCSSGCGYALTVLVNDAQFSVPGGQTYVSQALTAGTHLYNDQSIKPEQYTAKFVPLRANDQQSTFKWEITNGSNALSVDSYSGTTTLDANTPYSVTLTYADASGACLQVNHMMTIKPSDRVQAIIVAKKLSQTDNKYEFSCTSNITTGNQYYWDFGDGSTSTTWKPEHTFVYSNQPYRVKLVVVNGNESCTTYYQVPGSVESTCEANYSMIMTPVQNPALFSSVTVLLTDPNGKVFSSKDLVQPADSKFEIVSVEEYRANAAGKAVRKLKLKFNCQVNNGGQVLKITDADGVFAVAYQ
jgi:hypothetical protein